MAAVYRLRGNTIPVHRRQFDRSQIDLIVVDVHKRHIGTRAAADEPGVNPCGQLLIWTPHLDYPRPSNDVGSGYNSAPAHNATRPVPVPGLRILTQIGDHLDNPCR